MTARNKKLRPQIVLEDTGAICKAFVIEGVYELDSEPGASQEVLIGVRL